LQESTWQFLMSWLKPGDVFFDLGANIGIMSIPAAVAGARVTSFEMLSSNVVHLERGIMRNRLTNISVVMGALFDQPDYVGAGGSSAWGMIAEGALVSVPTIVLDDYVRKKRIERVDVMKIDIEGSEQKALTGARKLLERDHPDIVIEVNSSTCGLFGGSCRSLMRQLVGHGYKLYRILPDALARWEPEMVQEALAPDYLATIKTEGAIVERCQWPIRTLTDADIVASVLRSAQYEGACRLHIMAVADRLPEAVRTDPRVVRLLKEWHPLASALKAHPDWAAIQRGIA
jgi:FkbM family methyltransferase